MQSFARRRVCLFLIKHAYKRSVLSKIYNVFSVPHLLDLSPFWSFLFLVRHIKELVDQFSFGTPSSYWAYLCGPNIDVWFLYMELLIRMLSSAERRLWFEQSLDTSNSLFSVFLYMFFLISVAF